MNTKFGKISTFDDRVIAFFKKGKISKIVYHRPILEDEVGTLEVQTRDDQYDKFYAVGTKDLSKIFTHFLLDLFD